MIDPRLIETLLTEAAGTHILPRFRCLTTEQVREKGPGDLVTVADTETERFLTPRLRQLLPGSQVVGEEAVAAEAKVLDRLQQPGAVWIIDPVDGTTNFAHGRPQFCVIVALVLDGKTVMGWIHDPLHDRTVFAAAGEGSWCGAQRIRLAAPPPLAEMTGSISRRRLDSLSHSARKIVRTGCAGHDYLGLLDGRVHFSYTRRLKPWDHAAGVLLHREAGGWNAHCDGTPYVPLPSEKALLLTPDQASWDDLAALIPPLSPQRT